MKSILLLFTFILACYYINAQPGTLDKSFGNNGKVYTSYTDELLSTVASAIQKDDKIVVSGNYYFSGKSGYFVMRYLSNGTLDSSFGNNGRTIIYFDNGSATLRGMAIQNNGKILVTGYGQTSGSTSTDMITVRLNKNGTPDTLFGKKGIATTDFGTNEYSNAVCTLQDGRVILGGVYDNIKCLLVRLKNNGSLDSSFGDHGKVVSAISSITGIRSVAIQTDNKIVVGGSEQSSIPIFLVGRFNANGSVDNNFGNAGFTLTQCSDRGDVLEKILLQPDGKIIAVGGSGEYVAASDTILNMLAVRYKHNGTLDATFGSAGISTIHHPTYFLQGSDAVLQNDGKLLLTGYAQKRSGGNSTDFSLIRLKANGSMDSSFANKGLRFTNIKSGDISSGVGLQKTGDIIVAGYSNTSKTYVTGVSLAAYYSDSTSNLSNNISPVSSINIYPNPATNYLHISGMQLQDFIKIKIADFEGNIYLQKTYNDQLSDINITSLKPGNYLLYIETKNETVSKQFIKK